MHPGRPDIGSSDMVIYILESGGINADLFTVHSHKLNVLYTISTTAIFACVAMLLWP